MKTLRCRCYLQCNCRPCWSTGLDPILSRMSLTSTAEVTPEARPGPGQGMNTSRCRATPPSYSGTLILYSVHSYCTRQILYSKHSPRPSSCLGWELWILWILRVTITCSQGIIRIFITIFKAIFWTQHLGITQTYLHLTVWHLLWWRILQVESSIWMESLSGQKA